MPTRTEKTKQDYRNRARQIAMAENKVAGRMLSPVELVKAVMQRKLRSSSRRQIRAALVFTMTEATEMQPDQAAGLNAAIGLLRAWRGQEDGDGTTRTSQWKQKNGVETFLNYLEDDKEDQSKLTSMGAARTVFCSGYVFMKAGAPLWYAAQKHTLNRIDVGDGIDRVALTPILS
jgi:hypothetical protein